ncbi:MAG: transposase zinc-binding domain-containing protein [Myxococcales bacterium]|nr:transposase zinc-binding domain-containing protein [Myxococcales bacterium]
MRNYLGCGLLDRGFLGVRCAGGGFERLVGFSGKGRAVCPTCRGRRMSDLAAHLVDRVLPRPPYRQWTLSLPWPCARGSTASGAGTTPRPRRRRSGGRPDRAFASVHRIEGRRARCRPHAQLAGTRPT